MESGKTVSVGWIATGILGLFGVVALFNSFVIVDPGERGVVVQMGKVTERILEEGLTLKKPFVENVVAMDVKSVMGKANASAASKDLQDVAIEIKLNYRLDASKVNDVYQQVRQDYKEVWISPAIHESIKASTAQFTAEELVTKRTDVREEITKLMKDKLITRGIIIEAVSITDITFSKSFTKAIEAKVTAEQDALAAENKLAQVEFERDQRIAQAEGEAKAIEIQANAINAQGGAEYVNLKAIEKWDGRLPVTMMGDAVPMISL